MGLALSLENAARGITPTNVTAASGYSNGYLTDGSVASAWRSSTDELQYEIKIDLGTAAPEIDLVGVFDAAGINDDIAEVMLYHSPDAVTYTAVESSAWKWSYANARGDLVRTFNPIRKRYWKLILFMASNAVLDLGEIWLGKLTYVSKTFSRKQVKRNRANVINNTDGGGTFAAELGDYRTALQLAFSMLREDQHAPILSALEAVNGGLSPIVVIPDFKNMGEAYHGRFEDLTEWEESGNRKIEGVSLAFLEDGRAL